MIILGKAKEHSLALPSLGLESKVTFSSPVATAEFSKFAGILSAAFSQHQLFGFEKLNWNLVTSTSFVH